MSDIQNRLFRDEDFEDVKLTPEKIVCLGMEFPSDEARREYFREELRKKLPELKKIEGYPIGEDDDIINLSDPPYYTACPNPWLNDFIDIWEKEKEQLEKEGKRSKNFDVKLPYSLDVKVSKSNPIYTAHTYHTKVPHPAIMRYILHYTQPGDVIFDGFAGTGMTGVAAQACGCPTNEDKIPISNEWNDLFCKAPMWGNRHAICSDLSPYASMISYNYNSPLNLKVLQNEVSKILKETKDECSWLYKTLHEGKEIGLINYMVWSDIFVCSNCGKEFVYWDAAIDRENKCIKEEFVCPHCNCKHTKNTVNRAFETEWDQHLNKTVSINKSVPVIVVYTVDKKRYEKKADEYDFKLIEKIKKYHNDKFVPTYKLPNGYNTQQPKRAQNINYVHQFYTIRNLIALSIFYDKIESSPISNKLKFIFTGMVNRSTKMNRIHIKNYFYGGGGWNAGHLKGTLYIPNLPIETSILEQIEDKLNGYIRALPYLPKEMNNVTYVGSANRMPIKENSVDYIFTDPPFGANIMYSELNILPEAWLKVLTNNSSEAIVNPAQDKNFTFYLDQMSKCYSEYFRILKPGKWMTVEFSNTNAGIWNCIQQAITKAGFVIANVSALNKGQGGIRSITTTTAVKQDLAISCYKPLNLIESSNINNAKQSVWSFIEEHLNHLPVFQLKEGKIQSIIERDKRILYDRVVAYFVQHNLLIPLNAQEFQEGLLGRFIERDGMFFTASQVVEYEEKKKTTVGIAPMALFISNEVEGIEWLKRELNNPQTYSDLQPKWMKDLVKTKKGDILPELSQILEENFIKDENGKWRKPDAEKAADLEILRNKRLKREFDVYVEQANKPKAKRMKDTRLEVLRYGFKECYQKKDFKTIILVGDHIQEALLQEDEVLLQYYDIASMRV